MVSTKIDLLLDIKSQNITLLFMARIFRMIPTISTKCSNLNTEGNNIYDYYDIPNNHLSNLYSYNIKKWLVTYLLIA